MSTGLNRQRMYLIERVVFTFHVGVSHRFAQNVLVKRACKVALKQFVIIYGFSNDSSDEFEVAQVIGITVRRRIDHVRDTIAGRCGD